MKRMLIAVGVAAAVALTAGAAWISYASTRTPRQMVGVVVASGAASIQATDQLGAMEAIRVAKVVAPGPAWVVVYSEGMGGMPGALVGRVRVPAGESTDVNVPIDPTVRLSEYAVVRLQADRGIDGTFEFSEDRFEQSPDKPFWSGGADVRARVWVRFYEMANTIRS